MSDRKFFILKLFNVITFVLMVVVNSLANILPINGVTTAFVSDSYPNLFAPAGLTFSIWGLIYILLGLFVLYQAGLIKGKSGYDPEAVKRIGWFFTVSSIANTLWIFSWHYRNIPLSLVLMIVVLVSLIMTYIRLNRGELTKKDKIFLRLPISVYFGWITVAAIANVTTLLVSVGWEGFGFSESIWTILVLIVGTVIAGVTMLKNKDIAYGLVVVWAYAGIWIKHTMTQDPGFAGQYPEIINAVMVCIFVFAAAFVYILITGRRHPVKNKI